MTPTWLQPAMNTLRAAHAAGRLPHGLLIHEAPGSGGEWLAQWIAKLALCSHPADAPCDECFGCKRAAAAQHPDLLRVSPIEDSRQLRIEQVRWLAEELALTSHQGGYKVGVLSPADALNRFAANALLKTLEEPAPRTLLILVAIEPSRLPATILSRCQRIRIRPPERKESIHWLQSVRGPADWNAVLDVIGEAPFVAAECDASVIPRLGSEMREGLEDLASGAADPVVAAERWGRSDLALRLRCFENWITERIRIKLALPVAAAEIRASVHLPHAVAPVKLRRLFELMDGVRELAAALDTPLNKSLALEALLRRLTPERG